MASLSANDVTAAGHVAGAGLRLAENDPDACPGPNASAERRSGQGGRVERKRHRASGTQHDETDPDPALGPDGEALEDEIRLLETSYQN